MFKKLKKRCGCIAYTIEDDGRKLTVMRPIDPNGRLPPCAVAVRHRHDNTIDGTLTGGRCPFGFSRLVNPDDASRYPDDTNKYFLVCGTGSIIYPSEYRACPDYYRHARHWALGLQYFMQHVVRGEMPPITTQNPFFHARMSPWDTNEILFTQVPPGCMVTGEFARNLNRVNLPAP